MNNNIKNNNNKKRRVFVIILISAIAFVLLWCIGFFTLSYHNRQIQEKGLFAIVADHIKNDKTFNADYGTIISVREDTDNVRQKGQSGEYEIPCIVTLEDGRIYRLWVCILFGETEDYDVFEIKSVEAVNG